MPRLTFKAPDFFDLSGFPYGEVFEGAANVWEVLPRLKEYILSTVRPNVRDFLKSGVMVGKTVTLANGAVIHQGSFFMGDEIEIGAGVVVEPGALIMAPAIICTGAHIRQGAYIRGSVIVGEKSVVGHSTEMKNSIMVSESKAGHFAYVGDSILGKVNLGAGTKLANFKLDGSVVSVSVGGERIDTSLRKFGAILGDGVSTGCNSVTSPGTIIGKNSFLYPNATAKGFYPERSIIKPNAIGRKK